MKIIISAAVISLFYVAALSAQDYGKIISAAEADSLFGTPDITISFAKEELIRIISPAEKFLMVNFYDSSVVFLSEGRKLLYPVSFLIGEADIFGVFSIGIVKSLLEISGTGTVLIEYRKGVLTITNDGYTLEFSEPCPPFCS